ncbi:MAG: XRE family transcriptional regulator [Rhodanobacteraceae bacterium]|nr:MAG: XRE family transcriptional regulator [Rhodanobacteraceae bacterium]
MPRALEPSTVFSQRLRDARLEAGLSQKALGIRAELDPFVASTRINRYERGIHIPDPTTAAKLAKVLGVPVEYFYARSDRMARMIRAFDRLSATEQERALRVVGAP